MSYILEPDLQNLEKSFFDVYDKFYDKIPVERNLFIHLKLSITNK